MRRRTLRGYAAGIAAGALVVLTPAAALAGTVDPTAPVGSLLDQTQQQLGGLSGVPSLPGPTGLPQPGLPSTSSSPSTPSASPSQTPSDDSDIAPNETTNPSGPDHAGSQGLHAAAGGQDVADAGHDRTAVRRGGRTHSDATLLALGGQEVLGAHASSDGPHESHAGNPLQPLCDGSSGQVCLQVLYADAYATPGHGMGQSGIARICLGGSKTDAAASCDGAVAAGVLSNQAQTDRSHGRTTASSESDLADVCLTQPGTTGCTLSADALHSQGTADSAGPSARRGSFLLGVQGGGQGGRVDQPTAIQVPPGCPPPSALCAYLNQGETYLGHGVAGHAQDALKAGLLPGQPVEVDVLGGHTETLVHPRAGATGKNPGVSGQSAGGPGHPATGAVAGEHAALAPLAGLLPNTGGTWSGLLALGLLGVAAGSLMLAASRRRLA
ncbi:MAG TPA: hypothetical protein VFJ09_10080 [Nocardioidaceae bacterium]|nr:hypothetical protein [Nocardioidaceae bacterium]